MGTLNIKDWKGVNKAEDCFNSPFTYRNMSSWEQEHYDMVRDCYTKDDMVHFLIHYHPCEPYSTFRLMRNHFCEMNGEVVISDDLGILKYMKKYMTNKYNYETLLYYYAEYFIHRII